MTAVTALVLTLLEEFVKDLRRSLTINELARRSRKPYPNVHAATKKLLDQGILKKTVVGHSHLCTLNLENDATAIYLALLQTKKKERAWNTEVEQHLEEIKRKSYDVILVWKRNDDFLVVTESTLDHSITLAQYLADEELLATIGAHTLLYGHARYAHLLKEVGS